MQTSIRAGTRGIPDEDEGHEDRLKVWATTSTQNFRQDQSWLQTGIRWTCRQKKVIADAYGVRLGGGAPSSEPFGGERRDVRTLTSVWTYASERL